jgi:plasmid stabilization system protein ParE
MPRLIWSQPALQDVARLYDSLAPKSPDAACRAVAVIRQGAREISAHPALGRPAEEMLPEFREWIIEFGQGAYVALCHFDWRQAVILAVRHAHEAGY